MPAMKGGAFRASSKLLTPAERYLKHSKDNYENIGKGGIKNKDGSISTVLGTIIGGGPEPYRLVPSVWGGKAYKGRELIRKLKEQGGEWPTFRTLQEAQKTERALKEIINKQHTFEKGRFQ